MDENIVDLAGVVANLQGENERLRLRLLKAWENRPGSVWERLTVSTVSSFLYDNAVEISAGVSILIAVLYCSSWIVETLRGLRK